MRYEDLIFRAHYKQNVEISRVLFSNGHWIAILRHRPGFVCDSLQVPSGYFLTSCSMWPHQEAIENSLELSVTLAQLRICSKPPLRSCPWENDEGHVGES